MADNNTNALPSSGLVIRLKRGWHSIDAGLRWKLCVLIALTIGGIVAAADAGRRGYDLWPVFSAVLTVAGLGIFFYLLNLTINAITRLLRRAGILGPLIQVGRDVRSVVIWLVKASVWLLIAAVLIAIGIWAVGAMSIPVAIIAGAVIIASAIAASRR